MKDTTTHTRRSGSDCTTVDPHGLRYTQEGGIMARQKSEVFKLEITLGNDAMQTKGELCDALHRAAHRIANEGLSHSGKTIRDINGNGVGSYKLITRRET